MTFLKLYAGTRPMLVNVDWIERIESYGSGSTIYVGGATVLVTAQLGELEEHLAPLVEVGKPAPPPK